MDSVTKTLKNVDVIGDIKVFLSENDIRRIISEYYKNQYGFIVSQDDIKFSMSSIAEVYGLNEHTIPVVDCNFKIRIGDDKNEN